MSTTAQENEKATERGRIEREQEPARSDDKWHMGIRLSSVYKVKFFSYIGRTGVKVFTAHNGIESTIEINIDFKSDTVDPDARLTELMEIKDRLAAKFMK